MLYDVLYFDLEYISSDLISSYALIVRRGTFIDMEKELLFFI